MKNIFSLVILCAFPILSQAQTGKENFDDLSKEERLEDLWYFTDQIHSIHPAPYEVIDSSEWNKRIKAKEVGIENLDASGFFFRLQEIAAMVNDIHTSVFPIDEDGLLTSTYPFRLRWMGNDLIIRAAAEHHTELIGAKVISIQNMAISDVVDKVIPLSPGNLQRRNSNVYLAYLLCPDTYHYLGLLEKGEYTLKIEVINIKGEQKTISLNPHAISLMSAYNTVTGWAAPADWNTILDSQKMTIPIFYKRRDEMAWFQTLVEKKVLLVQINQPVRDDNHTMLNLISALYDHLINHKYERIILDLRGNEGGWFLLTNALAGVFSSFSSAQLLVLIGPETTSAGVVLATQIEQQTNAIFIGKATGSSPNFYAKYKVKSLPNTGFYYRISTKDYIISMPEDNRIRLWPDIVVSDQLEYVLAGKDAAFEKALSLDLENGQNAEYKWYERWSRPSQKNRGDGEK